MSLVSIRKYGTEPAKTETRAEDNDPETLDAVRKQAAERVAGGRTRPECPVNDDQVDEAS